jgi:hypothetical protein
LDDSEEADQALVCGPGYQSHRGVDGKYGTVLSIGVFENAVVEIRGVNIAFAGYDDFEIPLVETNEIGVEADLLDKNEKGFRPQPPSDPRLRDIRAPVRKAPHISKWPGSVIAEAEAEGEETEKPDPFELTPPRNARPNSARVNSKIQEDPVLPPASPSSPLFVSRSLGSFAKMTPPSRVPRHLRWEESDDGRGKLIKPLLSVRSLAHRPTDHNPIPSDEIHTAISHLL